MIFNNLRMVLSIMCVEEIHKILRRLDNFSLSRQSPRPVWERTQVPYHSKLYAQIKIKLYTSILIEEQSLVKLY